MTEAGLSNLKNQKLEARPLIFEAWPQMKEKSKMTALLLSWESDSI